MLAHFCSHLTTASKARHRFVPVLNNATNFSILSLLLKHGFITSFSKGSSLTNPYLPPDPVSFSEAPVSARRLVAELKYKKERPVLNKIELVSMPSRKIVMNPEELERFVKGRRVKFVRGVGLGEVVLVETDDGLVDGRDAIRRKLGGKVIARVV